MRATGSGALHAVAFLDPAAPTSGAVRLRATDVTEPNQHDQVRVFDVAGEPGQKVLPLKDLVLTAAMGFKAGHRYELSIEPVAMTTKQRPGAGRHRPPRQEKQTLTPKE